MCKTATFIMLMFIAALFAFITLALAVSGRAHASPLRGKTLQAFIARCEPRLYGYDVEHPPRICRRGCDSDEIWSRKAKQCVMSCNAGGCL